MCLGASTHSDLSSTIIATASMQYGSLCLDYECLLWYVGMQVLFCGSWKFSLLRWVLLCQAMHLRNVPWLISVVGSSLCCTSVCLLPYLLFLQQIIMMIAAATALDLLLDDEDVLLIIMVGYTRFGAKLSFLL